jgi:heme/copper-type cytochrome/quinol oxidase subunit 2
LNSTLKGDLYNTFFFVMVVLIGFLLVIVVICIVMVIFRKSSKRDGEVSHMKFQDEVKLPRLNKISLKDDPEKIGKPQ